MEPSAFVDRPDYRVDIHARRNLVRASYGDTLLAETTRALLVDEQDHGLVFYFPPEDVRLDLLEPSDHSSRCPFKGTASYWSVPGQAENVAWSYREPYPEVARIAGYIAFYQDRCRVEIGTAPYIGASACRA